MKLFPDKERKQTGVLQVKIVDVKKLVWGKVPAMRWVNLKLDLPDFRQNFYVGRNHFYMDVRENIRDRSTYSQVYLPPPTPFDTLFNTRINS